MTSKKQTAAQKMCRHFAEVLKKHDFVEFVMDLEEPAVTTHLCPPPPNEQNIPLGKLGFSFREDRILTYSLIPDWNLNRHSLKALHFCNQWNLTAMFPMTVFQEGRIVCSHLWFVSEETKDEFLWDCIFLQFFIASCVCFTRIREKFPFLPEENIYQGE